VAGDISVKKYVQTTDLEYFCNKSWTASFNLNTKSWVSFHTYLPNFYVGENNFFYSGLNEGCELSAVAVTEIASPTTTTTTTAVPLECALNGTAVYVPPPTTTTTTSSSTTTSTTSTTTSTTSTSTSTTTTTTTATPTTTTTTTQPLVWYNLYNCSTGTIQTSASFPNGTFYVNQRVVYGGSLFFYVTQVLYTDPGGIQWSVTSAGSGLEFCPSTTTSTTTTPPLEITVTISCDNIQPGSTYLGKASVAITGGSGIYQIKAGYVPTYSTLVSVGTNPFVITSPTANYDGALGLRNTTGGSDKFLVYVIDSFGTIDTSASDINCT